MTQTTLMRNSSVGDAWIQAAYQACPVQWARDDKGVQNGNILTGPVRLAFTDALFTPKAKSNDKANDPNAPKSFGCTVLFPPMADMSLFWQVYCDIAKSDFPGSYNPDAAHAFYHPSLLPPWREQSEKSSQYDGFTPGCKFINVRSNFKPVIIDQRFNPIVDPSVVYPGCWAIVGLQPFAGGKKQPQKGPMFGLQTVMKIADDDSLGGGAPDPRTLYGQANLSAIAPPIGGAAQAFAGLPQQGGHPPPPPPPGMMQTGYGQAQAPAHLPPPPPPPAPAGHPGAAVDPMAEFY